MTVMRRKFAGEGLLHHHFCQGPLPLFDPDPSAHFCEPGSFFTGSGEMMLVETKTLFYRSAAGHGV